ncbi:THAP domain-containing protein 1-like [Centruroides sculpturatus]|uniref:THAP domain-containing protein 1-like n=1 Tax=Centruroides sculpturatus TaxID=218467 RepID=UPI000C6C9440|nr:THAP domain-containing protein 1-like [Centruroides sculpturatus]
MPCCCVVDCTNRTEKGFRLFKLPQGPKNEERRKMWIKNIGRKGNLSSQSYVCQIHFTEDQFENNRIDGKKPLRWNAVPTIFSHNKVSSPKKSLSKSTVSEIKEIEGNQTDGRGSENQTNHYGSICDQVNSYQTDHSDYCQYTFDDKQNDQVIKLKQKLKAAYKKINSLEKKINNLEENLKNIFSDDQIRYFVKESMQGFKWSEETINKGLRLYLSCGNGGYQEIRKQNLPYPCIRTLQKHLEDLKCKSRTVNAE